MNQETLPTFGEELRRYRRRGDFTQEQLAEKLGITREAVSQMERGEIKRPNNDVLKKLEDILGLSRLRAYQLIGEVLEVNQADPSLLLQQIAALPSHEDRMVAWKELPQPLREAVTVLMKDLLQESALRL